MITGVLGPFTCGVEGAGKRTETLPPQDNEHFSKISNSYEGAKIAQTDCIEKCCNGGYVAGTFKSTRLAFFVFLKAG